VLRQTSRAAMSLGAVLWDLDGTLVDTAPDLCAVLATLLQRRHLPPLPFAIARNEVSNGAIGMLKAAFPTTTDPDDLERLRLEFLEIYLGRVCNSSRVFSGLETFLTYLDEISVPWGIVTNKPHAMTVPLLTALGIAHRPACVVSGDRLAQRKPHPAPLLLAAEELALDPGRCVYIGDAPRDIEAGRAAGMTTIAATYGYIPLRDDPCSWGADLIVDRPLGFLEAWRALTATTEDRRHA
jgi:phosphoglycolate phosphatase